MNTLTKVGDYEVRDPVFVAGLVRYQATHIVLPRCATIEMLDVGAPRSAAIRLMRHACILEALHHPGVPRVFECGMLDGRPWVAFERSEGLSLEVELRSHRLTVDEVLDVVEQVAGTLAYAHARGVLHRNISPAALIRDSQRGQLVLHGWCNACTHDTELAGPLRGTTRYRAPELIHDRPADGRADVYSLGAIALQALQGVDAEPRAHDVRVEPAALAKLLESMTADDVMLRPTAAEVVAAIAPLRHRSDADDSDVVLLDRPRVKPRWTPQWRLDDTAPHGIVEIMPRRRRAATDVDER